MQVDSKIVSFRGNDWELIHGDCCEALAQVKDGSIGYSIFSPPFASLYTYSDSPRDMGNCKDHATFYEHFGFLASELKRVLMPGRLLSFHCMPLPTSKTRDGFIGVKDFPGELIRIFEKAGFHYHSEVCIWKDPVTAMQRTKAIGLLHKQICKDSAMSRQGLPDKVITMRNCGDNPEPISGPFDHFVGDNPPESTGNTTYSIDVWQRYASPVWMDINPSYTLQFMNAREEKDERHICPLQLQVIHRCIDLWSNPGDLVLSPFAGIGSEGYEALKMDRRFIGVELKKSYFDVAVKNLNKANAEKSEDKLFS